MGILTQYNTDIGGLDDSLIAKIGAVALNTTAQDLSSAINEHEQDIISIINNKVSKSGDILTGDLQRKNSNITVDTSSDNHVTTNQYGFFRVSDSEEQCVGQFAQIFPSIY